MNLIKEIKHVSECAFNSRVQIEGSKGFEAWWQEELKMNKWLRGMAEGQQQGEGVNIEESVQKTFDQYIAHSELDPPFKVGMKLLKEAIVEQLTAVINFLEKIDSSSMSDKTWLLEQKNLRQEGKELRERLTGKEIEEVIVKLKK